MIDRYFANTDKDAIKIVSRLQQQYPFASIYLDADATYDFSPYVYRCAQRSGLVIAVIYFRHFVSTNISNMLDAPDNINDPSQYLPF